MFRGPVTADPWQESVFLAFGSMQRRLGGNAPHAAIATRAVVLFDSQQLISQREKQLKHFAPRKPGARPEPARCRKRRPGVAGSYSRNPAVTILTDDSQFDFVHGL